MKRDVSSRITVDVTSPADLIFAIAASDRSHAEDEAVAATLDGRPVGVREVPDAHGTRLHRVQSGVGRLEVRYSASVTDKGTTAPTSETDLIVYTRPSRYAESDSLGPTAHAEFAGIADAPELLASVSSWVGTRLAYVSGSSLPTDGAVRTLLARQGVCRDYAHLCVALLRGLGIPARLVAVYAPGLTPMDFHAVAEAYVEGGWYVVDATTLAPRGSLLRISTGRDASDTAFMSVYGGLADLRELEVLAIVDVLPADDVHELTPLA